MLNNREINDNNNKNNKNPDKNEGNKKYFIFPHIQNTSEKIVSTGLNAQ